VAVLRSTPGDEFPGAGGVLIYDNANARPSALCGLGQSGCTGSSGEAYNSVQWNSDASLMFATEELSGDFFASAVTSSGFGKTTNDGPLVDIFGSIHYDPVTKYVYHDGDGAIIDPGSGTMIGKFVSGFVVNTGILAPDGSLGTAFFLGQSETNFGSGTYTLTSFDMQRLTPIASATISNMIGTPKRLIRWGSNGLAIATVSGLFGVNGSAVYILGGSLVGPAPAPESPRMGSWRWIVRPISFSPANGSRSSEAICRALPLPGTGTFRSQSAAPA
jgi:hypothetical protein